MLRLQISVLASTALLALLGLCSCAGQTKRTRSELESLQERVAILQNERDRLDERVTALEQQAALPQVSAVTQPAPATTRPLLRVVRLQPEEGPQPGSTQGNPSAEALPANHTPPPDRASRVLISGSGSQLTATEVPLDAKETP